MITKLVLDIDGVLTTGHLIYSKEGKIYKVFGPHDSDGLKIIKNYIKDIQFITADKVGWDITYARIVTDWKFSSEQLHLVPEGHRMEWFLDNCNLDETAFIGDGYHDAPILSKVKIGIAPSSAREEAKLAAKHITLSAAGSGAVLDACLYLKEVIINENK
jgi:YrbI family 3-deoxy-D-manno-octulosonate 8-phosphate phosphatase